MSFALRVSLNHPDPEKIGTKIVFKGLIVDICKGMGASAALLRIMESKLSRISWKRKANLTTSY